MNEWGQILLPARVTRSELSFVERLGSIYEHSAWVAEAVWPDVQTGAITSFGALAIAMAEAVDAASDQMKLKLLRAHPELASKAAIAGELTTASNREQSGAGLTCCTPAELARIQSLNAKYRDRFGFPFIIAVTGLTRTDIINAMARRTANSRTEEQAEALRQVDLIARIRLAALAMELQEPYQ